MKNRRNNLSLVLKIFRKSLQLGIASTRLPLLWAKSSIQEIKKRSVFTSVAIGKTENISSMSLPNNILLFH